MLLSPLHSNERPVGGNHTVRVLIIDDSATARQLLTDSLSCEPDLCVVGQASSGSTGLQQLTRLKPDVVTIEVDMPGMDGIETLKQIRERFPAVRVVMFSSATEESSPATLKAWMNGASDCCAKPTDCRSFEKSREYVRRELVPKLRQFRKTNGLPLHASPEKPAGVADPGQRRCGIAAVVIGISTGGPQALASILPTIPAGFHLPILIVQHMPLTFTGLLAQRLNAECHITVEEAKAGQKLRPGLALLAPGGSHLKVVRNGSDVSVLLDQTPPENSCRPAVDVLFRSAAEVWNGRVLAAVLTGMGQDGLRGAKVLKDCGATLIAQDEHSSVVWGMPGAIANAGLADEVLNLQKIVPAILKRTGYKQ